MTPEELKRARHNLAGRILIDGQRLDADITGRIVGARRVRTMEGAASLELDVSDSDMKLLQSGVFTKPGRPAKRQRKIANFDQAAWDRFSAGRVSYEGWFVRLAGVSWNYGAGGGSITITLEDEAAWLLRHMFSAVKTSRGRNTRAEFIHTLAVRTMIAHGIRFSFFSPQEGQRQPIAKPDTKTHEKHVRADADITVKGNAADAEQRRNMELVLQAADEQKASERATLALLEACIQESVFHNLPGGDSSSAGILQLLDTHLNGSTSTRGGRRDVKLVARLFLTKGFTGQGGAIALAARYPDETPGRIAQRVQGAGADPGTGATYEQWRAEAEAILDAWGGVFQRQVIRERKEFRAGGKRDGARRNYWDDTGDLASEVRWRRIADLNVLWFVNDQWLFGRSPALRLDQGFMTPGVLGLSGDADIGMPVAELNVTARLAGWDGPPGGVVDVDELGPLSAKWLTWEHRQDLFTGTSDLVLRRPAPQLKEPAPTLRDRDLTETRPDAGSPRAAILAACRKALKGRARYFYDHQRPYPPSLFPTASQFPTVQRIGVDCSSFVTLIYKAAGVPDPNGRGYDGDGWTATLWANGERTTDPQPGDLCFYGDPGRQDSHVNVYAGDGEVFNMGRGGVTRLKRDQVRGDFHGFRTYV